MDSLAYLIPLVPLALLLGFRHPHVCCAFLLAGATPYFAATEWLGVSWSSEFTAIVYATASLAALAGLIARRSATLMRLGGAVPVLAIVYMAFWIWRRVLDPPIVPGLDVGPYIMIVYGVLAFLPGLLVTDEECWHKVLDWTAVFGLVATGILVMHWWIGTTGTAIGRWLPVRSLTGIIISLELGIGFLALRHALGRRTRAVWVTWPILLVILALMSKLGERGPSLFLVIAVALDTYLSGAGGRSRRLLFVGVALSVVALGLYIGSELEPTSRVTDVHNYQLESNTDRTGLFSAGLWAFNEQPLWGWGGSLVGRIVHGEPWAYVHCAYLDPFIDTGLVGGLVFWSMLIGLAVGVRRSWAQLGAAGGVAASALPLFLLSGLEAQVSGTVWSTRHLWFVTGVLAQLIPRSVRIVREQFASRRTSMPSWNARAGGT